MINQSETKSYVLLYKGRPMTYTFLNAGDCGVKVSLSTLNCNPIWKAESALIVQQAISSYVAWPDSQLTKPFIPRQYREGPFEIGLLEESTKLSIVPGVLPQEVTPDQEDMTS